MCEHNSILEDMQLVIIAHNLRSAHNVGSLLRTADGLGITEVILTGYTPYPLMENDTRMPHLANKIDRQINKTALDAAAPWRQAESIEPVLADLRGHGYTIAALEQSSSSIRLPDFESPAQLALILGREVEGVEPEILAQCDLCLEIPMFGSKESFNVVQAAAMAMYHVTFYEHMV